jgi:hypothetical protein
LLEAGDFVLQKLPKTLHLFVYKDVKLQVDLEVTCVNLVSRVTFREMANNGLYQVLKKPVKKLIIKGSSENLKKTIIAN